MKQKTKAFLAKAFVGVFALSLVGGATALLHESNVVDAATQSSTYAPYLEYKFDDSASPWKNTGSAGTSGDMTKYGGVTNIGGWGLQTADNGGIYLTLTDKESDLVQTDEFTFSVSYYVDGRTSWHSVPFSWSSFDTTNKKRVSRTYLLIGGSSQSDPAWLRFGDTDLTDGGTVKQQWYNYEGKDVIPYNATKPGWTNLVVSIKAGGKAYVKAKADSTTYELEYDVPADWTLFDSVKGDKFIFAIGGSPTYDGGRNADTLDESKAKMQCDNVRFYDVGLCEADVDKLLSNVASNISAYAVELPETTGGKVTADKQKAVVGETVTFTVTPDTGASVKAVILNGARVALDSNNQFSAVMTADGMIVDALFDVQNSVEIRPELEYLFDNSANMFVNTGATAGYTLGAKGTTTNGYANGSYYFDNNATLYLQTKAGETNNWFYDNNVNTFTVAFDTKAQRNSSSNWWQTAMNWVALGDSSNAKTSVTAFVVGYTSSHDWFKFTDSTFSTKKTNKTYYDGTADVLYTGDKAAADSGWVRILYSIQPGGKAYVNVYDRETSTLLGGLTYDVPSTWTTYNTTNANDFSFSMGGSYTKNNGSYGSNESRYRGYMDNVRIYDFAMSQAQMEEYAMFGKITAAGVRIVESANGEVTVDNYAPNVGEEVVFNVTPNNGYQLATLTVNGAPVVAQNGVYKTTMVAGGLYVEATFEETFESKLSVVEMGYGASVRYGGTAAYSGLRFQIAAPKAGYETIVAEKPQNATVRYGILIIPEDYQSKYGVFTMENLFGEDAIYHLAEKNTDGTLVEYTGGKPQIMNFWTDTLYFNEKSNTYAYFGAITDIMASNLTRKFVGVGVIEYTVGEDVTYLPVAYANDNIVNNTRSVYQVAKIAMTDETESSAAKAWIKRNYIDVVEGAVNVLAGKRISILGDSISTYEGVSNDATANETIASNEVFYNKQMSLDDTWFMQTINNVGASLLVNNSWAGSNVGTGWGNESKGGSTARAENLHSGAINPDIIAVYMGINDCGCLTALGSFDGVEDIWNGTSYIGDTTKFATAYATMVHKIVSKYDAADVFLFTLPRNGYFWADAKEGATKADYNALQDEYNAMIYKIAEEFGCQVVDLATAVGEDYSAYLLSDAIHPNAKGMDVISAAFETALYTYYTANAQ